MPDVEVQAPRRMMFVGSCGYWTDDWSKPSKLSGVHPPTPCCPECKLPGAVVSFRLWHSEAEAFELKGNKGYLDWLLANKEKHFDPKFGLLGAWAEHQLRRDEKVH